MWCFGSGYVACMCVCVCAVCVCVSFSHTNSNAWILVFFGVSSAATKLGRIESLKYANIYIYMFLPAFATIANDDVPGLVLGWVTTTTANGNANINNEPTCTNICMPNIRINDQHNHFGTSHNVFPWTKTNVDQLYKFSIYSYIILCYIIFSFSLALTYWITLKNTETYMICMCRFVCVCVLFSKFLFCHRT